MSVRFQVNVYQYDTFNRDFVTPDFGGLTESGQADNVRQILRRFAVGGTKESLRDTYNEVSRQRSESPPPSVHYAAEFADNVPVDSELVDKLLDTPDLSMMDELEVVDFVNENVQLSRGTPKKSSNSDVKSRPEDLGSSES